MITYLLTSCIIVLALCLAIRKKRPNGLPPGEWGWPIIGMLPYQTLPLSYYIDKFKKKYGKIFTWRMGGRTFVFLCDYKVLKSAFNNPLLSSRPRTFSLDVLSNFQRLGVINNNGVPWVNLRRFMLRHLRDSGMGKSSLEDVISYEIEALVKDFKNRTNEITEIPWSLHVAIINVLWGLLTSKRYDLNDQKFQDFQKLVDVTFNDAQSTTCMIYDLFPWIDNLIPHSLKGHLGLGATYKRIDQYGNFLREAIDEHKATLNEDTPRDYLDYFLIEMKHHAAGKGSENTSTFTEDDLLYSLSDIFGTGSTPGSIKWVLIYMINYPEIQKKIQAQIDEFVPRDRLPTLGDREKIPYVDATFYEVMRIQTLSPVGFHHCAQEDTTIGNYKIPKGTMVVAAIEACHLDPDYWDEPTEFKPERFILPDGTIDGKKDGFLPFSIGRRVCIGESLTRMEAFLFIAALLQNFTFSAPNGTKMVVEPDPLSPLFVLPKSCKIVMKERM